MRATLALIPLTLVLAACGGSSDTPAPPAAAPAATTTAAATAAAAPPRRRPPRRRAERRVGASPAERARRPSRTSGSDGNGATVTRLLVADAVSGATRGIHYVDGAWSLPVPVGGAAPEGIAWDANRAVLVSTDEAEPVRDAAARHATRPTRA